MHRLRRGVFYTCNNQIMRDKKSLEMVEVHDAVQIGDTALGISASVNGDDGDNAGYSDEATCNDDEAAYDDNDGNGTTGTVANGGQSTQQSAYHLS